MTMEDVLVKLQEAIDRSIRNEGRIKKLEDKDEILQDLAKSTAVMAEQIKTMNASVKTLTSKVDHLEDKPKKKWENLVEKTMWFIVAAVLGFVLAHFGF